MASRRSGAPSIFSEVSLIRALSAVLGSIVSGTLFYPLNTVRLKLQCKADQDITGGGTFSALSSIIRDRGLPALFQGWQASTFTVGASSFLYFYLNSALQRAYQRRNGGLDKTYVPPFYHILIAAVSGAINVIFTTPLWVATTRLSLQMKAPKALAAISRNPQDVGGKVGTDIACIDSGDGSMLDSTKTLPRREKGEEALQKGDRNYDGLFQCLSQVYRHEGVKALWAGLIPSLFLVSNPAIQTVTYEKLLAYVERSGVRQRDCTPMEIFTIAAFAKAAATVATYPLQIVQAQLQYGKVEENKKVRPNTPVKEVFIRHANDLRSPSASLWTIFMKILREEGFQGLFVGMGAKLWQTVLNAAFMYMTYETTQRFVTLVVRGQRRRRLRTVRPFMYYT